MRMSLKRCTNGNTCNGKNVPRKGEVWVVKTPFDRCEHPGGRPVLVMGRKGDTYTCYKCTTKNQQADRYRIQDETEAGVERDTYIDSERFTVSISDFVGRLGKLSEEDIKGFGKL